VRRRSVHPREVTEEKALLLRHRGWNARTSSTGTVVPFRAHRRPVLADVARRSDDSAPGAGAAPARAALLKEADLRAIEGTYPDGITAVQIVDAFTSRGIKFSEASFRKYVQQGLLPRSRRVGRKGKHRGSLGVYPSKTVRRINAVKQLMVDGYTIEEIQGQFLLYTDLVEGVAEHFAELWSRLGADVTRLDPAIRRELEQQLADTRRDADRLVERLGELTRRFAAPRTDSLRLAGAAGGAEDLL
jgi:DNA-binding transcriptional MerR regulator